MQAKVSLPSLVLRRRQGSASSAAACPQDEEDLAGMRVGALRMMQHGAGRSINGRSAPRRKPNWVACLEDQTKEVKRSNVDERQFLTNDADGKTVFDRAKNASRNRLQRSLVAASEYQNNKENQSDLSSAKPRMDDRDLEDIEQEVEEQIQIATANGEFDNVEGKGKPLKSLLGGDNPYLDQADRVGYGLLKKHGFAPEWIEQQKRIHSDLEQHVRQLSEAWAASKFEPTHAYVAHKDRFRQQMAALNKRVRDYNLSCPKFAQMLPFDTVMEARRAKREAEAQAQKASANLVKQGGQAARQTSLLREALFSSSSIRRPVGAQRQQSIWLRMANAFKLGS
ncbi:unnamed protein product [Durusdinium trenchii]|uniref:DnaJ homologue subfamily C member 28 conserved domain-containing protein n=1 Tax=Durusdinium trenchii TaxID=1381693 RepID=A0ABP0KMC5_9DINO